MSVEPPHSTVTGQLRSVLLGKAVAVLVTTF